MRLLVLICLHVLLCLHPSLSLADQMDEEIRQGKEFGKRANIQLSKEMQNSDVAAFLTSEGSQFDAQEAKRLVEEKVPAKSEVSEYLCSSDVQGNYEAIGEDEAFLHRAGNCTDLSGDQVGDTQKRVITTIEKCRQTDAPYPLHLIRTLEIDVVHHAAEEEEMKICQGHMFVKHFQTKKSAKRACGQWQRKLAQESCIKKYNVSYSKISFLKWRLYITYLHCDGEEGCDCYQTQTIKTEDDRREITSERWVYHPEENLALSRGPNCSYFESICLDATPSKVINGKRVKRQCWKEKLTFLCRMPDVADCPYIKDRNCTLMKKECLNQGKFGCALWELTFQCNSKTLVSRVTDAELYGLEHEVEYEPNDSFEEVTAKLAVFDAVKEELQSTNASNAVEVLVFKGKTMTCSKSVADNMMYDCCFAYSGLAKKMGLSTCSADELSLAEMREEGLCHYVGSYSKKFIDLWKSRDEHVFCCFGSKLARILQEQAREQLGIGWGEPQNANSRGLSVNEISRLDFGKMDFGELYSDYKRSTPKILEEKIAEFQNRLEIRIKEEACA